MSARFKDLCLDAVDDRALADWWCGATLVRARDEDIQWDVMADPEGNEFRVFTPES